MPEPDVIDLTDLEVANLELPHQLKVLDSSSFDFGHPSTPSPGPGSVRSHSTFRSHRSFRSRHGSQLESTRSRSPKPEESWLAKRWFGNTHLDRQLKREHITGIAFSGTIGIGLFINSGEVISVAGSLGLVLGYICASLIVVSVNRSLAEMVSVRPLFSAIIDFPHTFVDPGLGFATGVTYVLAQCTSMATLMAAAVEIAADFAWEGRLSKGQKGGIVAGLFLLILGNNVVGVRAYGNLERAYRYIKILTILSLCVLMILVNVGVGRSPTGSTNYTQDGLVPYFKPNGFNETVNNISHSEASSQGIPGSDGRFLAVWTSITITLFSCMGGEIVIVAAGEAKYPRRDLPAASRFMYLAPLSLYILTSFLLGFNINYANPKLFRPWALPSKGNTAFYSPFVIVLESTSLAPSTLKYLYGALFLFSAYSAANTALYAASRTLFAVARTYGNSFAERTIGRTNHGNTPLAAIVFCSVFGFLAFIELADDTFDQAIISLAAFYTGCMCCVYSTECVSYMRFMRGLTRMEAVGLLSRNDDEYERKYYRARWQPLWACIGFIGCMLILLFSGWPEIYILCSRAHLSTSADIKPNSDLAWGLVGAYAGPIVFATLYGSHKFFRQSATRKFSDIRDAYVLPDFDNNPEDQPETSRRGWRYWIPELWSFIK